VAAGWPPSDKAAITEAEDVGACAAVAGEFLGTAGKRRRGLGRCSTGCSTRGLSRGRAPSAPTPRRAPSSCSRLGAPSPRTAARRASPPGPRRAPRSGGRRTRRRALRGSAGVADAACRRNWLQDLERDRAAAATARQRLSAALYGRRRGQVERQAERPAGLLDGRGGDNPDLHLARDWLAERHAVARRHSAALVVTAAKLLLATLLTALLFAVMVAF
jgi:hypothetical protein